MKYLRPCKRKNSISRILQLSKLSCFMAYHIKFHSLAGSVSDLFAEFWELCFETRKGE